VRRAPATAKINLALLVGPKRSDGKHEVATLLQRVDLADRIALQPSDRLTVEGFEDDTLVRDALVALAAEARTEPSWGVSITKRIPVAAGLGGGSSDAATALRLANDTLAVPLGSEALAGVAAGIGADVPFFLEQGPQLGTGDGTSLAQFDLPQDYFVLLVLPHDARKSSTGDVYAALAERGVPTGFRNRRAELKRALARIVRPRDLADLPPNDLARSPLADELRDLGAFRADVSGAGPVVYGLFMRRSEAERARTAFSRRAKTWLTVPAWYG
jgi:4-diphosphocytidyl-2-C-methyl-D-erythritol kinase